MSEAELKLWDGGASMPHVDGRFAWRLFSPSFRLIVCAIARDSAGFELRVTCGEDVLTSLRARELETLHQHATEWRGQLEGHGYIPADAVRLSEPRPNGHASEARTALKGLVECAALLELRHRDIGRSLRDRATEGLVAVGLSDQALTRSAIDESRSILESAVSAGADIDLIKSCLALLDRADPALGDALPGEYH